MGQAGAAAAQGQEVRPATQVEQAAVDRRDPLADPHGRAVAGSARTVRTVADGVWLFRRWQRDGTWQRILTGLQLRRMREG
jgi:hypothetical protein